MRRSESPAEPNYETKLTTKSLAERTCEVERTTSPMSSRPEGRADDQDPCRASLRGGADNQVVSCVVYIASSPKLDVGSDNLCAHIEHVWCTHRTCLICPHQLAIDFSHWRPGIWCLIRRVHQTTLMSYGPLSIMVQPSLSTISDARYPVLNMLNVLRTFPNTLQSL